MIFNETSGRGYDRKNIGGSFYRGNGSFYDRKNLPWITIILAGINILAFVVLEMMGSTEDAQFMYDHGALLAEAVWTEGQYYRLLTAAFLHFGAAHLMNNMLMLCVLGDRLEKAVGRLRYLIIYLVSAIGANVFSALWYMRTEPYTLSAGASGAIMGIAGGMFGVILRRRRAQNGIDRRSMVILIVLSLYSGYAAGNANNLAHLSGLLFGFLLGLLLG